MRICGVVTEWPYYKISPYGGDGVPGVSPKVTKQFRKWISISEVKYKINNTSCYLRAYHLLRHILLYIATLGSFK